MHTGAPGGEGVMSKQFGHKNTIKHEKGDHLEFLTTPCTPLKRISELIFRGLSDFYESALTFSKIF
jgi:hypothetical protein